MNENLIILLNVIIIFLIFYILYIFIDKSIEYNKLKLFIDQRKKKLEKLFKNINKNNSDFVKNDIEISNKIKK